MVRNCFATFIMAAFSKVVENFIYAHLDVGRRQECLVQMTLKATNDEKLVCQQELEIYVICTSVCVLWRDASGAGDPKVRTSKWRLIRIREAGRRTTKGALQVWRTSAMERSQASALGH